MNRRRLTALVTAVALTVSACSSDDRPSMADWEPEWRELLASVPSTISVGGEPTEPDCEVLLAAARTHGPELEPTPDPALDGPVQEWISLAETVGFECTQHDDLDAAVTELGVLEAEIDAAIEALGG